MEKGGTTTLIIVLALALLGLVAIQAKWVHDTWELKDAQLSENIDNALVAVSERLERAEARGQLGQLPGTGSMQLGSPVDSSLHGHELNDQTLDELLRGILSAGMFRNIHERIDPRLLDSLIREELQLRHIPWNYEFGVFGTGGAVLLGPAGEADTLQLVASPHQVRLFRNDWWSGPDEGNAWWLRLHVAPGPAALLHSLWPLVAASSMLLLVVAVVFGLTVNALFRQKRLGEIKNDLVNNLTHELKTPISTISLACEALNDPAVPKDPEQLQLLTGMIREENKRLGMLVENVLLSAVTESEGMQLKLTDVDMHALLAEVVRTSTLLVGRKGGSISLDPAAELAHVRGDRTFLTSIFYNLIDNAVKYCVVAPVVKITTRSDAQTLTIEVQDNGLGIPRAEQRKIFDRLYRIPTGNVHNVKGFGLGLSYVRSVVDRHGGRIRVESNTMPGDRTAGSRFIIDLPFEQHGEKDKTAAMRG